MRSEYFLGLDLGQSYDYSALAVVHRVERTGDWDAVKYAHRKSNILLVRHLERMPLETPYPEIVDRTRDVTRHPTVRDRCQLAVDATGVGRAVVDLMRRADMGCTIWPVNVTGGLEETRKGGYYGVPKRDLMIGLLVLLQSGALQIADELPEGPALREEFAHMRVRVSRAGREQFGNSPEGKHDDLVFAVALACWVAKQVYPTSGFGDSDYWKRERDARPEADWLKKGLE